MTVTVERYLKVVHPFWSKKNLKRWMVVELTIFYQDGRTVGVVSGQ